MDYFIGIDIGTTAIKGILISLEGKKTGESKINTEFIYPKPGYIEYDPNIHYKAICTIIQKLVSAIETPSDIKGISMAAASGNTLFLDNKDKPLTNIISWMDARGAETVPDNIITNNIHSVNGWPWAGGYFPMAHINWFKKEKKDLFNNTSRICMNNDWLYYCLTGEWKLDTSTATTFYLQNQIEKKWNKSYLKALNIDKKSLSAIGLPGKIAGYITKKAEKETGLKEGTPVVLGTFDHPGAARGTGFTKPGDLLLSCGTSWVGFYPVKNRDVGISQDLLIDPFLSPEGPWGVMFALSRIDLLVNWYLDTFIESKHDTKINKYLLFGKLAAKASPGAEGCFIDPNTNIEDIFSSKNLSDSLIKQYSKYSTANIARAIMEMTVYKVRKNIEKIARGGIKAKRIAMVGGPSESPVWPQITADITGLTLNLINGQTAGAVGAAMLAAIGAGYYKDEKEAFTGMGGEAIIIKPNKSITKKYNDYYIEYKKRFEKEE